ncbi:ImuA family protein [Antarcticirhabdus aurantiaca]|uniref:ImuA family protein n=1 Tax=Antarcticirhabdus aurantiaca TaxID=2606717 RepID=UPI00131C3821|nr:ImuA family protein [Antarcticirhabdus aurantiaca]
MPTARRPAPEMLSDLRERIQRLEGREARARGALPFGVLEIDRRLPGGGLALGALHEVAGGGNGAVDGAAAALFTAGIAARTKGKVLWCVVRQDLFAPAIAQAGLAPGRVVYVEAGDEKTLLACFEDALRHGGLSVVIGEVAKLSMTASRRLQLAAEGSGTTALAIRRWRRQTEAADFGQPTASVTRWRVSVLPSVALPVPGVGRARWLLELIRCRAGECADFEVEACDATGRLALSPEMAHRSPAAQVARQRAAR